MSAKSKASVWSRLLSQTLQNPPKTLPSVSRKISTIARVLASQTPGSHSSTNTHFSVTPPLPNDTLKPPSKPHSSFSRKISTFSRFRTNRTPKSSLCSKKAHFCTEAMSDFEDLLDEVESEKKRERDDRQRKGLDTKDIDDEDEEDYLGVMPLIQKLEKRASKEPEYLPEPTDSDSSDEDEEIFSSEADEKREEVFEKKFKRHKELLDEFTKAETLDDVFKCMSKIDKFEEKHFRLRPEYRVIGELMNRLKVAEGKEKFILQQKLNRAMRLIEWKEAYDPNNPSNYGVIQLEEAGPSNDSPANAKFKEKEMRKKEAADDDNEDDKDNENDNENDDDEEFDDTREKDNILLEKLDAIDKKLEEKLAELDHTFGKKGKLLEEEIRDLAEERNALIEKKRKPLYQKGFDVRLIDVNRTCKVTKGGQVIKYSALLACGNYHGVIGYAKAKGSAVPIALQKAYEKCFQNLHYVERHEEHTIAHAIQTSYKKTKVYLWPAPTTTGMRAGKTVETILNLAGYKNVKSKVVGSRNPYNTVKALFKALNAVETPKDIQEKFGRTVVEKYLL
ncbi:Ribosomal protein S5 [Corchorus olitorius]|uniref:Ribosomal protein S5 n=1 Tax=Corchorus olitorius TaxID=93759 RepID=A0A1R3JYV4_9ROSI|nr:Ribosomal protein S5 [Corchorus olitorius]